VLFSVAKSKGLDDRSQQLLKILIESYIEDGQPVGSRKLSKSNGLNLSPATIRNVMSDLEDLGLVKSPHTSAGRVPTTIGYRTFVDSLITVNPMEEAQMQLLNNYLKNDPQEADLQEVLKSASNVLSSVTHLAGLVTVPKIDANEFRQIEFLPLSNRRVLVILVINKQDVQNRIVNMESDYSIAELEQAANYLNQTFSGRPLEEVRQGILNDLNNTRLHMNEMMQTAIKMAGKVFEDKADDKNDFVLAGQTNLMDFEELSEMAQLRQLFEAFNQKSEILNLFDRSFGADGVQIFIGKESDCLPLKQCSMITSSYSVDGKIVGALGVIGPTRMNYKQVIPVVDVTAKLLGSILRKIS